MRVVTFGIPDCSADDFQQALGLTDDEMFALEQSYLQRQAELSALREQNAAWNAWRARSEKRYRKLYTLVHRLLRVICDRYGLTRKYELQDLALENADPVLTAAWKVAELLEMRTLPR